MREYGVPASYSLPDDWSCVQSVYDHAAERPEHVLFRRPVGGDWTDVTAREFVDTVRAVGRGLVAAGVEVGDRVALLSSTRYEWTVVDFAIWAAGAVTVPIYHSSSTDQIRWIMEDSGSRLLVVETDELRGTAEEGTEGLSGLLGIHVIDGEPGAVAALSTQGESVDDSVLDERRAAVVADSPASLIYTSGTTGRPKGCLLTHRNFIAEAEAILATSFSEYLADDKFTVMFLPLAHVLARAVTYAGIHTGVTIAHTADLSNIVDVFGELRPHYILAVPRVFEKVFATAQATAQDGGRFKARVFARAVDTAIAYSKADEAGSVGPLLRIRHLVYSKLVYGKLVDALGGRCEVAISGGAPLGDRLGHFFSGIGVNIFEGYGLTETCAAHCVNTPGSRRIGTVGRPLPGNTVRIAESGEIEVGGPVVAREYWGNEDASAEAFVDGWFRTGDLGELDEEGYLKITGRTKEIIVTAGGKNIAPNQLEDALRADPMIAEAVCVGDGRPFISVLLTVDPDAFARWKSHHGKSGEVEDLRDDKDFVAHMDAALAKANRTVSHTESIKKYAVLPTQFTEESGELTPSMKVKRKVVTDRHSDEIEALYS